MLTRGLEYLVLLFAAHYLLKEDYGELEYYKKMIEVGSSVFAFGFPMLIINYTKSKESKKFFFLLSVLFVLSMGLITLLSFWTFSVSFLIIPFLFYAIFFNGGITPAFLLVYNGSNRASIYKIIISILFYTTVLISIYFFNIKGMAYVYVNYVLFPIFILYIASIFIKQKIILNKVKTYWKLFKKLLLSSFTLVISNFANLMFLYTDIFIIKFLSDNANIEIANYSFALNIANILLIIPLTLVQVDIEKLKNNINYVSELNKKILVLVFTTTLGLICFFIILTNLFFNDYKNIFIVFLIILSAKIIQSFSPLYGSMLIIKRKFKTNLLINLSALFINILLSYILYSTFSIQGIAIASVISLLIRQLMLYKFYLVGINVKKEF